MGHQRVLRTVPCATQEVLISDLFYTLCVLSHSVVSDSLGPRQAPLFMEFSRQEYWSGLPCLPPGDLPNPGIKSRSSSLQVDSLLSEPPGKHFRHSSVYVSIPVSQFILPQPHVGFILVANKLSRMDIFLVIWNIWSFMTKYMVIQKIAISIHLCIHPSIHNPS